jgi:hypothetical protein
VTSRPRYASQGYVLERIAAQKDGLSKMAAAEKVIRACDEQEREKKLQ